jgi:type II secretory pathway component PulF
MTSYYRVLGLFDGKPVEKAYFVSTVESARRAALHDGARAVYRIKPVGQNWFNQQFIGREYGMLLLRAINFQIDAGVPAAQAVQTAIESESNHDRRARLQGAVDGLARGASLADALFATGLYDQTVHSILMSGERIGGAGAIKSAMDYLLDRQVAWKTYSFVLSALGIELSTALSVPPMLSDLAIPYIRDHLPKSSPEEVAQYVRDLDAIAFHNMLWMEFSAILVVVAAAMTFLWFMNPRFKDWLTHHFLVHIPMIGDWYTNDALARSCKVFASMIKAGVRMPDAIQTILSSASNAINRRFWSKSHDALNAGLLPGAAFAASGLLRKDEVLVLKSARGHDQFAVVFISMAEERAWRQKVLGSRIFWMSVFAMVAYIAVTLLIGFKLFGLFNAGLDMNTNSMLKGGI